MAYKQMNYCVYLSVTLLLYGSQVAAAMLVSDIGLIFEFVSAISVSCLAFIFPGVFYLVAERRFATELQKMLMRQKWMRCKAIFFVVFGLFAFTVQLIANIAEIIQDAEEHKL